MIDYADAGEYDSQKAKGHDCVEPFRALKRRLENILANDSEQSTHEADAPFEFTVGIHRCSTFDCNCFRNTNEWNETEIGNNRIRWRFSTGDIHTTREWSVAVAVDGGQDAVTHFSTFYIDRESW